MDSSPQKNVLLCTLGSTLSKTWLIAVEALYFVNHYHQKLDEVHLLTTCNPEAEECFQNIEQCLKIHFPGLIYTFTQVDECADICSQEDYFLFQEVLYRWFLKHIQRATVYVCIASGRKTMSAALLKGASLFGAKYVFDVLAEEPFPSSMEEVKEALKTNKIKFVSLGNEKGWTQLKKLSFEEFPLNEIERKPRLYLATVADRKLQEKINEVQDYSLRIHYNWGRLSELPFPVLARWTPKELDWLNEPLDPKRDKEWIEKLPKVELHCHLGGFATHGELLAQVRSSAEAPSSLPHLLEPPLPEGWPRPAKPIGLETYMELGRATGTDLLKDPGCLKEQCRLLYQALQKDRVVYAEIRTSPNNYTNISKGRSAWTVLCEIRDHFQQCMNENQGADTYCHVNLIIIVTRKDKGDLSDISRHLSLAVTAAQHFPPKESYCGVVGVDLAGLESPKTRASYFAEDFVPVHRCGLAVTAHAGEIDDVEGIWQAIFRLHARRIGHALHLLKSQDLLNTVIDRHIGIEMCPLANYQIHGFKPMENNKNTYPLKEYLNRGVYVTVNTDNIGISKGSLTDNLLFLAELCPGIRRLDILKLLNHACQIAFLPHQLRTELIHKIQKNLLTPTNLALFNEPS